MLSGYDEDELKEVLMKDVETEVYELRKGAVLLDKIGDFAPAWGMIGTLIGLIIMLQICKTHRKLVQGWQLRC